MGAYRPFQPKVYSAGKTLWKFVKTTGILGAGAALPATFPEPGDGALQWALFAVNLAPPVVVAIVNFAKNKDN